MTADSFTYWLQGYVELTGGKRPTAAQWATIQDHLKLVFTKVTPDRIKPMRSPRPPVYCTPVRSLPSKGGYC